MNRKYQWGEDDLIITSLEKGDYPGHPFRGNQWTKVASSAKGKSVALVNNVARGLGNRHPADVIVNLGVERSLKVEDLSDAELKARIASEAVKDMRKAGITDEDFQHLFDECLALKQRVAFGAGTEPFGRGNNNTEPTISSTNALKDPKNPTGKSLVELLADNGVDLYDVTMDTPTGEVTQTIRAKDVRVVTDPKTGKQTFEVDIADIDDATAKLVTGTISPTELLWHAGFYAAAGNVGRGTQLSPSEFRKKLHEKAGLHIEHTKDGRFAVEVTHSKFDYDKNEKLLVNGSVKPEMVVAGIIHSWAMSSGSFGSLLVMDSVTRTLGGAKMTKAPPTGLESYETTSRSQIASLSPRSKKVVDAFTKSVYDRTQKVLKDAGVSEITLSRGLQHEKEMVLSTDRYGRKVEVFTEVALSGRTLQSFAQQTSSSMEFATGSSANQIVIMKVPSSRIFSIPTTGPGCRSEDEFVVISKKGDKGVVVEWNGGSISFSTGSEQISTAIDSINMKALEPLSKKQLYLNMDESLPNSDWLRSTFDLPQVKTTADYLEAFAITTPQQAQKHIDENRSLVYWQGVPKKIKAELAMYATTGQMR